MALGSVSVPGTSKKAMERMMYMDGKLVWSAAMGNSGGLSVTAPDTVDYIVVRVTSVHSTTGKDTKIARGCSGNIALWQYSNLSSSSGDLGYYYGKVSFASEGKISVSYPKNNYNDYFTVEGYQYI